MQFCVLHTTGYYILATEITATVLKWQFCLYSDHDSQLATERFMYFALVCGSLRLAPINYISVQWDFCIDIIISSLPCDMWLCNQHMLYLERFFYPVGSCSCLLHVVTTCLTGGIVQFSLQVYEYFINWTKTISHVHHVPS